MKKCKLLLLTVIAVFTLILGNNVYASKETDSQKLLYQDITINSDGSIKVKEALWVNGDYNGTNRKIRFKDTYSYSFTGIYSNFSGDSDIYNATEVSDIKVFDISQSNFNSINDINNLENQYEKVENASNGKYGVYTIKQNNSYLDVTIYCPSKKSKVFYLEYTIKNAVVVHNDIAELYWCFLENESSETLLDYKAIVHLPEEDTNIMAWSHGPPTGICNIVDNKTISLVDTNIIPNEYETVRIMFDKKLVPQANKFSNVDGKEHILKYEKAMANVDTASTEKQKINLENNLSTIILNLSKEPHITNYNRANELLQKLTWDDTLKEEYKKTLSSLKQIINEDWKNSLEFDYNMMINNNNFSQSNINSFIEKINIGFDESIKAYYYEKTDELQRLLNERNIENTQKLLQIIILFYYILGAICLLKLVKLFFERKSYYQKYYRDFPSNDKAYIVDYLMNKKITAKTFFVAILDLISEKKILLETTSSLSDEITFVLSDKEFDKNEIEQTVIEILFNVIGKNNRCTINEFKNYETSISSSNNLIMQMRKFERDIKREVKDKDYFKKDTKFNNSLKISTVILSLIATVIGLFTNNGTINILYYYFTIIIFGSIYYLVFSMDKGRSKKGQIEYSKWLAHKRFLKDFGRFKSKDLPEIILWERYFVTAVTLGCSKQVLKRMEIKINDYDEFTQLQAMPLQYLQYQNIQYLEHTINTLIHSAKSHSTIKLSSSMNSSNHSSGDGFGGGSSSGGSGGGGGGWSRF